MTYQENEAINAEAMRDVREAIEAENARLNKQETNAASAARQHVANAKAELYEVLTEEEKFENDFSQPVSILQKLDALDIELKQLTEQIESA